MSCPVALLHAHIGTMLADFMVNYPQVTVHLEATNRVVDPIEEAIDLVIRVRPLPLGDSNLVVRVLADRGQCLVANPALFLHHDVPRVPTDLTQWPSLGLGPFQQKHSWILFGKDGEQVTIHHTPRLVTSDMIALRNAALAGVGIVQLPTMMVREELTQDNLIRLLPEWAPRREIIHAVFPSRRGLLPSIRVLIDYFAQRFEALVEE